MSCMANGTKVRIIANTRHSLHQNLDTTSLNQPTDQNTSDSEVPNAQDAEDELLLEFFSEADPCPIADQQVDPSPIPSNKATEPDQQ